MKLASAFRCFIIFTMAGFTSGQSCEPCLNIGPLNTPDNDPSLVGTYRKLEGNSDCPEGCGYLKDGDDKNDTWCFKHGPYIPQYACFLSTTKLTTISTVASSPPPSLSIRIGYVEDGIVFEQEDTFNNITGEATINVPAHGDLSEINIVMQQSTDTQLISSDDKCQISSIPSGVQPGAIDQKGEKVGERGLVTQDQESTVYSMKISQGEVTEEDKANLTQTMSSQCAGKSIEKIKDVSVNEAKFSELTNGGIIKLESSQKRWKLNRAECSNIKRLCMSSGKSCWRWPYGSNSFSVHRLQVDTVCVDCCGDDQSSSSLCKCADLQSREKLNQCYEQTTGRCPAGTKTCGGACQNVTQPCNGECLGTGKSLCGDRCVAKKYLTSGHYRDCNGKCITSDKQCDGQCMAGYEVCGPKCVSGKYSKQLGGYKTCGDGCISKLAKCNGLCEDGFFSCGKSSCRPNNESSLYKTCGDKCLYNNFSPCNGVCPSGTKKCGSSRCLKEGSPDDENYRECGDLCVHKSEQCQGSCPQGFSTCGAVSCLTDGDMGAYFECGDKCMENTDWIKDRYRPCGPDCLARANWDKFWNCSGKCIPRQTRCNGNCQTGDVLCNNVCYGKYESNPCMTGAGTTGSGTTGQGTKEAGIAQTETTGVKATQTGTIGAGETKLDTTTVDTKQPGTTGVGTSNMGISETGKTKQGATEAAITNQGTPEAGTTQAVTTELETTKKVTDIAETTKAITTQSGITKPSTTGMGTANSGGDTTRTDTTKPDTTKPDTAKPDTTKTDTTKTDTTTTTSITTTRPSTTSTTTRSTKTTSTTTSTKTTSTKTTSTTTTSNSQTSTSTASTTMTSTTTTSTTTTSTTTTSTSATSTTTTSTSTTSTTTTSTSTTSTTTTTTTTSTTTKSTTITINSTTTTSTTATSTTSTSTTTTSTTTTSNTSTTTSTTTTSTTSTSTTTTSTTTTSTTSTTTSTTTTSTTSTTTSTTSTTTTSTTSITTSTTTTSTTSKSTTTTSTTSTSTTTTTTTRLGTCESGWSLFEKRCYKFSAEATEWANAKYLCECAGAELVSIASQGEDEFIVSLIGSEESWTGLNDLATQETYLWTDGTTFSYTNWNTKQPSNTNDVQDCVKIRTDGKWDDVTCTKTIKYVCEKGDSSVTKKPVTCTTPAPSTSAPTVITTQSLNCDSGWSHHQGKCYKLMTDKLSWDAARTSCVCTQSAELASLTTAAEQAFAKNLISENTWIGATDVETENTFIWSDGTIYTTADYSAFWSSGQPNNAGDTSNQDCVSMKTDGLWDDVSCATTRQFICEKPDKTATALTANPACSCASGWSGSIHTKKCYKKFTTPLASFDLSRTACQDESADLASIGSVTEQTFVWSTILENSSPNCWIGGEDKTTDGTFVWTDGTSLTYTNWATLNNIQQPAGGTVQNCLQMRFADGFWDDAKCDKDTNVYICKK